MTAVEVVVLSIVNPSQLPIAVLFFVTRNIMRSVKPGEHRHRPRLTVRDLGDGAVVASVDVEPAQQ